MCGDCRELEELEAIKEAEEAAIAEAEAAAAEAAAEVAMDLFGDDNEDDKVKNYQKYSKIIFYQNCDRDINRMFLAVSCYLRNLDLLRCIFQCSSVELFFIKCLFIFFRLDASRKKG
jgi:hypothetical protein